MKRLEPAQHVTIIRSAGMGDLLKWVARRYQVAEVDMLGTSHLPHLSRARQCLYYHLRQYFSSTETGLLVGRDHTTVLQGTRAHQERIEREHERSRR